MTQPPDSAVADIAARQPRRSVAEDAAQSGAEIVLAALPFVGPALQTSFAAAANIVSARTTEAWLQELALFVDGLAVRLGQTVEDVVEDPAFYEAVVRGTRAAQETRSDDKLSSLRHVVMNSGSWAPTETVVQAACLRLVSRLEPEHLAFLALLADPQIWIAQHPELGDPVSVTMAQVVPLVVAIADSDAGQWMAQRFLQELYTEGLTTQGVGLAFEIKRVETIDVQLTPLGIALISMLRDPSS